MNNNVDLNRLLKEFNDTEIPFSSDKTIIDLFEYIASKYPLNRAIFFNGTHLTYKELNQRANQLAGTLLNCDVGAEDIVGILVEPCLEMIIAILGVLKSGAAYMPIAPEYPAERIALMLSDSSSKVLLTTKEMLGNNDCCKNIRIFDLEDSDTYNADTNNIKRNTTPNTLAYVIYTSGSTGKPKGVMIENRSLVNLAEWNTRAYEMGSTDRCTKYAGFGFDASVYEVFPPLIVGAELYIIDKETKLDLEKLCKYYKENKLTISFLPTQFAEMYMDTTDSPLKALLASGDKLKKFKSQTYKLHNGYGPTEATILAIDNIIDRDYDNIPIGKPISNYKIYIVDKNMNLCSIGEEGELCISGVGLARCYLNRPELTAEKFISNPFATEEERCNDYGRLYKTGDLAQWTSDGNIEFLGRIDFQVKVRGFRIELGEIETKLIGISNIEDAVVLALDDGNGDKFLCAYYISEESIEREFIKNILLKDLPSYMVPNIYVKMNTFPLTANGKIDRNALPKPEVNIEQNKKYVAPSDIAENNVVEVWQNILGVKKIGIEDDFFDLGGNSLKAVGTISKLSLNYDVKISDLFNNPILKEFAKVMKKKDNIEAGITKIDTKDFYIASDSQKGMYLIDKMGDAGTAYNIPMLLEFNGTLDRVRLEKTIDMLVERHEAFRTSFDLIDGEVVQKIHNSVSYRKEYAVVRQSEIDNIVHDCIQPFNLNIAPLFKVKLFKLGKEKHVLFFDVHHIVFDGGSVEVFLDDLISLYKNENLKPIDIHYKDYSAWEVEYKKSSDYLLKRKYWEDKLSGDLPVLSFSTDFPRKAEWDFNGNTISKKLSHNTYKKIEEAAKRHNVTLYTLFLSAFNILLSKYTRQEDIIMGTAVSGRVRPEIQKTIGMFVNSLPFRTFISTDASCSEILSNVQVNMLGMLSNQDCYLTEIVNELGLKSDAGRNPIYDIIFNYLPSVEKKNLSLQLLETKTAKFDINLSIVKGVNDITLKIEYKTSLFKKETIDKFILHYISVLNQLSEKLDYKISEIDIVTEKERNQIIDVFNGAVADYPLDSTIVKLFEEVAEKYPENRALVFKDKVYSYKELSRITDYIGAKLRASGIKRDDKVAISIDRNEFIVIGALSVNKAGGAYIFIDPTLPINRKEYIVKDCNTKIVLADSNSKGVFLAIEGVEFEYGFEELMEEINQVGEVKKLEYINNPEDIFGIITTSGSTGEPKGTMVEHRNYINFAYYYNELTDTLPGDQVASYASFSFDVSVATNFAPLLAGATVHIIPTEIRLDIYQIARYFEDNKINVTFLPTPIGELYIKEIDNSPLKSMAIGGEQLKSYRKRNYNILNAYAPSECTVAILMGNIDEKNLERIPLGWVQPNNKVYIFDEGMNLCPIGVPGELYIGGVQVGRGYHNRPDQNSERFITHAEYGRLYKSGDLAKWMDDGQVVYLGRIDFQVKISGLRIELGEIENRIVDIGAVEDAVVLALDAAGGNKFLCGYYVSNEEISKDTIRDILLESLPEYMVPNVFVFMKEFPITPNGKINRKSLPVPELNITAKCEYAAPENIKEEKLASVWSSVLGIEKIGVNDDYFDLGGNSLTGVRIIAELQSVNYLTNIKDLFKYKTIRLLAEHISESENMSLKIMHNPTVECYETTGAQNRLYYTEKMSSLGIAYNIPMMIEFSGVLNMELLGKAIDELIQRHDILRTSFMIKNGIPLQIVQKTINFKRKFEKIDIGDLENTFIEFVKPFNLEKAPLFRIKLVSTSKDKFFLFWDVHHILCDGTSVQILINELVSLYNGLLLPEIDYNYIDYTIWQKEFLKTENAKREEQYWLNKLSGELPSLDLPLDHPRKQVWDYKGDFVRFKFGDKLSGDINRIINKYKITQYTLLFSVYNILLSKLSAQEDIIVGCVTSGRTMPEVMDVLGMFVSTLPVRTYPKGTKTFKEYLEEINDETLEMLSNQNCQFDEIIEKLDVKREIGRTPVFDVIFNSIQVKFNENDSFKIRKTESNLTAKFDLNLNIVENGGLYEGELEYRSMLFDKSTIEKFIEYYLNIIEAVLQNQQVMLENIDYIGESEKRLLLGDFNDTYLDYSRESNVIEQFEMVVEKYPDNIAVVFKDESLTYRELNNRVNQLSTVIRKEYLNVSGFEIVPDTLIPICVDVGLNMIIGILAILKSGGAYVPLVHDYPEDRIKYILEDSDSKIILTLKNLTNKLTDIIGDQIVKQIFIDELDICSETTSNSAYKISPKSLCYVLYTSGTTGKPKGVMIEHRSLLNGAVWGIVDFDMKPEDNMSKYVSFGFDVSTAEIYPTLLSGATLHLIPEDLRLDLNKLNQYFESNNITISHLPTQIFEEFIEFENKSLTRLITAGEKLKKYRDKDYQINNGYGPTETYFCTNFVVDKSYTNIPIGKPIINDTCYVLDKYKKICPIGVSGELYVGGDGVARGYYKKPELTAEKFLNNPFVTEKDIRESRNSRIYKTGDLVRWLPDGNLEYLGRTDFQVKIRGFRVELGEIESKLLEIAGVNEAAVLALEDENKNKYLCGYYVLTSDISEDSIKIGLRKNLPDYMIPEFFIKLDDMPLTPNGKVNRKALPEPNMDSLKEEYLPPVTEPEKIVASVWQDVLQIESIGIKDDFFKLGGNSLKVIRSVSQLQLKDFKVEIDDFFKFRTIEELAKNIKRQEKDFRSKLKERKQKIIDSVTPKYTKEELNAVKSDYDAKNTEFLKKNLTLSKPIKNVLVSGTTGYLGCYILHELISTTDKFIYCIVRGHDSKSAVDRQYSKLKFYFGDDYLDKLEGRIKIFKGDLSIDKLGLADSEYLELEDKVESIIHSAANVSHYGEYEVFYKANVQPAVNLIELAKVGLKKDIHFISTRGTMQIGTIPGKDHKIYTELDNIEEGQTARSVYIRSKLEGERVVLKAREFGLNTNIYRVGNLIFSSKTKKHQENINDNGFYQTIKAFLNIGCVPDIVVEEEMSHIDYTAGAICRLFDKQELQNQIFHVYSPHISSLNKIFVAPELQLKVKELSIDDFFDFISMNYEKEAFTEYIEQMMLHLGWLDEEEESTQFTVLQSRTMLILEQLGFIWDNIKPLDINESVNEAYKDRRELLCKQKLFENIDIELMKKVSRLSVLKQVEKEHLLISEGIENHKIYFILDGMLAESKKSYGGWEGTIRVIADNNAVGLENITENSIADSSFENILKDAVVLEMDIADFRKLMMHDEQLFQNMYKYQMDEKDKLKRMIIALS